MNPQFNNNGTKYINLLQNRMANEKIIFEKLTLLGWGWGMWLNDISMVCNVADKKFKLRREFFVLRQFFL